MLGVAWACLRCCSGDGDDDESKTPAARKFVLLSEGSMRRLRSGEALFERRASALPLRCLHAKKGGDPMRGSVCGQGSYACTPFRAVSRARRPATVSPVCVVVLAMARVDDGWCLL